MQMIPLGTTGRATTQLGFGGSSIMGVLNRRQSLSLLESAFDSGIRHFDTAPMYGYGEAESCLGEFLGHHRGEVTVTTKFGIAPPQGRGMVRIARAAVAPLLQRFPGLKSQLPQRSGTSVRSPESVSLPNAIFTPEQARASLERSLAALRTERIDLWLLHDVKTIDLAPESEDDALLRLLEDVVREGKVGMFGVGTDRGAIPELVAKHPEYCAAMQYEWSILNQVETADSSFRIHHRALSGNLLALAAELKARPERCRQWSREVCEDLADSAVLARLMLKAACLMNPAGVVLFSSKRPEHIRQNIAVAEAHALEAPARKLYEVVHREGLRIAGK